MDGNDEFVVSIEGPGMSVKQTVNRFVATQVLWAVFRSEHGSPTTPMSAAMNVTTQPQESVATERPSGTGAATSIRELLNQAQPKRIPETIAVMAVFLKDARGIVQFTREHVRDVFREAHEPVPMNLSRDLSWAVKLGLVAIMDAAQGTYYVTNLGMKLVSERFPEEWRMQNKASAGGRPRKSRKRDTDVK